MMLPLLLQGLMLRMSSDMAQLGPCPPTPPDSRQALAGSVAAIADAGQVAGVVQVRTCRQCFMQAGSFQCSTA